MTGDWGVKLLMTVLHVDVIIVQLTTNIKGNLITSFTVFSSSPSQTLTYSSALELVCLVVTNIDYCNEALGYNQEFTCKFSRAPE